MQNIKFEDFAQTNDVKFDVIHMHNVLEHVQSPKNVLSLVKTQLKDDGIIIIEVPNQFFIFPLTILFNLGRIEYPKPYHPYHHLYFFSPKTIKLIMGDVGFNILELNIQKYPRKRSIKSYIKNIIASTFNLATSSVIEVIAKKE